MKKYTTILLLFFLFFVAVLHSYGQNVTVSGSCFVRTQTFVFEGDPSVKTYNGKPAYYNATLSVNYEGRVVTTDGYLVYETAYALSTPEDRWVIVLDGEPYFYAISTAATAPHSGYLPFDSSSDCGGKVVVAPADPIVIATPDQQFVCSTTKTNIALTSNPAGATFSWTAVASGTVTGFSAGTGTVIEQKLNGNGIVNYTITPTLDGLTGNAIVVPVTVNGLSVGTSLQNIRCNGLTTGTASVTVTGGTAPYTYLWNNGNETNKITGLAPGIYSCTVSDFNGCSYTQDFIITEPAVLSATTTQTNLSCNGDNNGIASVTVTGGTAPYTYLWSNSATTASISALTSGEYSVNVTDANGCTSLQKITITEPQALTTVPSQTNVSCNGSTDGTASVTATGGKAPYTYLWSNAATTASISTLVAGEYSVDVTDANGCTSLQKITITEPQELITLISQTNVSCNGSTDGTASVTATGGTAPYTYLWSNSATTASISGLAAGEYSVEVTDANGCTSLQKITITEPQALTTVPSQTNVSCNGSTDGTASVTATGGTAPYTYLWSNAATTASISTLVAGEYSVDVTDANGCTSLQKITITEPQALTTVPSQTNVSCNGSTDGTASVTPTGGTAPYTYLWSNAATTASISGLAAGEYSVTVTDANGCTSLQKITITEPQALTTVPSQTNVSCNGSTDGTASVTPTGGTAPYTYLWNNAATTASISTLVVGEYSVDVTDANGCTSLQKITITEPQALTTVPSQTNVSCNGSTDGTASITASGGTAPYTYLWSNAATTASISTLVAGEYSVDVTDANGCTVKETVTITISSDATAPIADIANLMDITADCQVTSDMITIPTATDNCAGKITATTTDPLTYSTQGNYIINWKYEDGNGNTSFQTQKVIIKDVTAPIADIANLMDITADCQVTSDMITIPTATDNCAGIITATTTDPLTYSAQGNYVINWKYDDGNGTTSFQTQNVIIKDVTAPIADIANLMDITADCQVTSDMITVPTATDNCAGIITATTTDPLTYSAQGNYVINWKYVDGNGNTSFQTQKVIIKDVTAPIADVANLMDITADCQVTFDMITIPTATDNCAGKITATTTDPLTYSVQGNYVINWKYDDGNGTTSFQSQNVIIKDVTAPIADIANLMDITADCQVTSDMITIPTATDNCAGKITATTLDPLTYSAQGNYVINWKYVDGNGTTSFQSQNVIIKDVTAPIADIVNLIDITADCQVTSDMITIPTATDNCAGKITATTTDPLTYSVQGNYVINWKYVDGNGTTSFQTQKVNVLRSVLDQVTLSDSELVYDGKTHTIEVENLPKGATVMYATTPTNGTINAGTYTITATVKPPVDAVNCLPVVLTATLKINKAPQQITFNALTVKNLKNEKSFQLDAFSSSGLAVYYSFKNNSNEDVATVTSQGLITLLSSGEVTITAHQDGNANYLAAESKSQIQVIEEDVISEPKIIINGKVYEGPLKDINYVLECGESNSNVSITSASNTTILPSNDFTIETPKAGVYKKKISILSADGSVVNEFTISVQKNFKFSEIVLQKFNNTLLVNNNPQTNGGYTFTSIKWYKNNKLVGTDLYYSEGGKITDVIDPNADYKLVLVTSDGDTLETCSTQITTKKSIEAILYPNPVQAGKSITIEANFPKEELENMHISIYSLSGNLIKNVKSSNVITEVEIPTSIQDNVYLVLIKTPNIEKSFKVLIKN